MVRQPLSLAGLRQLRQERLFDRIVHLHLPQRLTARAKAFTCSSSHSQKCCNQPVSVTQQCPGRGMQSTASFSMNNMEQRNFQEPDRGRFGTEEIPHGSARDRSTCGRCVVPDNPSDVARGLTENRARRVPSPRAVREHFPKCERRPIATRGASL